MTDVPDASIPQALLLDLHSGMEVVKSQQTEINRRIGRIEKAVDEDFVTTATLGALVERIEELEDSSKDKGAWKGRIMEAVYWAIGITIAASVLSYLGLEVRF